MDRNREKERSTAASLKGKVYFSPYREVTVEVKGFLPLSFRLDGDFPKRIKIPHTVEEGSQNKNERLFQFFNDTLLVWKRKGEHPVVNAVRCSGSFIWEGHELIGMPFEEFLQMGLLHFEYWRLSYLPAPGAYFRNYKVFYDIEHEISVFVWKRRIRIVILRDLFFSRKLYEDAEYLEQRNFKDIRSMDLLTGGLF